LQDRGGCSQSSQIGPHLLQPFNMTLTAITPNTMAARFIPAPCPQNCDDPTDRGWRFQAGRDRLGLQQRSETKQDQ
jgi:hypothetical protein